MDAQEINSALLEAARQSMLEILEEEMRLESLLSDLPETDMIISIIKRQLGLGKDDSLPGDLNREQLMKISEAVKISFGEPVFEALKEIVKQPKLLKALKNLFSTHSEDFGSLDPVLSKRYADVLLDFAERYMDTQKWKKTQSIIVIAESLVKNVTGAAKPRLFARLDVNWGIYLWKCGDYSEAEKKFQKANAGVGALLKKHGKDITDPSEIAKNMELQARLFLGFGVLYADMHEDKTQAIKFYKDCLSRLSELGGTYRNSKMKTSILNNLGVTHHRMAELFPEERDRYLNEAATHFEGALSVARGIHFTRMEGWVLFNVGEIYAILGQLDKAEECSRKSRRIYTEETPNERGLSGVEMLDAVISMERKEFRSAIESIDRSMEIRQRIGEPRRIADALDLRGDIRLASGDMEGAAEDYREAQAIYESIGSAAGVGKTGGKLSAMG